jgi:hypothetical protein
MITSYEEYFKDVSDDDFPVAEPGIYSCKIEDCNFNDQSKSSGLPMITLKATCMYKGQEIKFMDWLSLSQHGLCKKRVKGFFESLGHPEWYRCTPTSGQVKNMSFKAELSVQTYKNKDGIETTVNKIKKFLPIADLSGYTRAGSPAEIPGILQGLDDPQQPSPIDPDIGF